MSNTDRVSVERFTVRQPMEEVYRRIVDKLNFLNYTKTRSNMTISVAGDDQICTFDMVRDGTHKTVVMYRPDRNHSREVMDAVRGLFEGEISDE